MFKKLTASALFALVAGKKMQFGQEFAVLKGQKCPLGTGFFCSEDAKFCSYPEPACYEETNSDGIMEKLPPISTFPTMKKDDGNWCPIGRGYYCGENCSECSTSGETCFCKNEANQVVAEKPLQQQGKVEHDDEKNGCFCGIPGHHFPCPCTAKFCIWPPPLCF